MTYEELADFIEHRMSMSQIHLIRRREGDTPDPWGGIRGAVPEQMSN